MADSKVKVVDAGGVERYVRPVDAAEIVKQGGKIDTAEQKVEDKTEGKVIIEGVTTNRADSVFHVPVSPDSARESIDYDLESGDNMPGGKVDVEAKAAGKTADAAEDKKPEGKKSVKK